jgi:hypothetical protein
MTMAAPSSSSRRGAVADVAASEVEMRPLGAAGATEADLETEGRFAPPGGAVAAVADRVLRCCRHKGGGSSGHNDRYSRYGLGLAVVELFEEALRLQAPLARDRAAGGVQHLQGFGGPPQFVRIAVTDAGTSCRQLASRPVFSCMRSLINYNQAMNSSSLPQFIITEPQCRWRLAWGQRIRH